MRYWQKIKSRKVATDVAIIAAVGLIFAAGVFFESRRSGGSLQQIAPPAGAVTDVSAGSSSGTENLSENEIVSTPVPTATADPASSTPAPVSAGTPDPEQVGKQVFLDLSGIENESVIEASEVTIVGTTTPDALLSINGQAVEVQLDGTFSFDLVLEPGPNFVEIVSSNLRGQETNRVISVVSVQ